MTVVLDSWAGLRYLEDTRACGGAGRRPPRGRTTIDVVDHLGEVHYVFRRSHGEEAAIETVRDLREVIDVGLPDERLVLDAARIKADHPVADADAFAAALSIAQDATLWTGAPELLVEHSRWHWRGLRSSA